MPRLFTGLEVPREVGEVLSMFRGGLPGARWIDPENYHITLRFIGDIDDRLAHDIASSLEGFAIGTDPYPDRSATLVIEVPVLGAGTTRRWRGPGIDGQAAVAVGGLGTDFWQAWADNHALFPCGIDIVFAAGSQLLALPRSIAVEG